MVSNLTAAITIRRSERGTRKLLRVIAAGCLPMSGAGGDLLAKESGR